MIHLRIFFLTIILATVFGMGHAETIWDTGYETILVEDTARSEVIYVHIAKDPKLKEEKVRYERLGIGDNITVYAGQGNYQLDTLFSRRPPEIFNNPPQIAFQYVREYSKEFEPIPESLTIHREKGVLNFYGKVFMNYYRYSEPIPEFEWTLTDETEEIMGYPCNKATTTWRGREWTAWYSDIPINAGPWKFQGLPGLILKVEDSAGEHSIYAIGTENIVYPIGHPEKTYTKATRKKYNEALEEHATNYGEMLIKSGMVTFKSEEQKRTFSKSRKFHAPLELE